MTDGAALVGMLPEGSGHRLPRRPDGDDYVWALHGDDFIYGGRGHDSPAG